MTVEQFTQSAKVLDVLRQLKHDLHKQDPQGKKFSDVIDDGGHQYVDLVMEGGGVLGIALLGYVYVLEEAGIRFLQLGGTSAGSITTMLMAAAGPIAEAKSPWLIEELANKNLGEFIDGDSDAREFIQAAVNKAKLPIMLVKAAQIRDNLTEEFGLNPGRDFHQWIKALLREKNIRTSADLDILRSITPAGFRHRLNNQPLEARNYKRVAVVAADVTTQTKAIFPEMAKLYWLDPDNTVDLADYVRASMSVPVFFHPFKVTNLPKGVGAWNQWHDLANYVGEIPDEVHFIDGGIMSNFPIDLFHDLRKVPEAPTFGVKLGIDRSEPNRIQKFPALLMAIFDSARTVHDFDFILRNPDYRQLVTCIDTGPHNWLNFNMSETEQVDLFVKGARSAAAFLKDFDWAGYKKLREGAKAMFEEGAEMDNKKKQGSLPIPKDFIGVLQATKKVNIEDY